MERPYVSPLRTAVEGSISLPRRHGSVGRKVIPGIHLDVEELARFLVWLEEAVRSNEEGAPLPKPPAFRDQTLTRWTEIIMGLAACAEDVEARLRGAERSVDQQADQLRDQTLQVAEQLAGVYEFCDRTDDAQAIRLRAAGLSLR